MKQAVCSECARPVFLCRKESAILIVEFVKKLLGKNERLFRYAKSLKWLIKISGEASPLVYHCRGWTSSKRVRNFLKKIVSPFYMGKFFFYRDIPGRKGLAIVLIAKNEAPYIEEWINFHARQGVSHFFIYDNESTDNLHEILKPYIDSGLVTYRFIKGKVRQNDAYNMAIHDYGRKFKYMAFIDTDEFLFVRKDIDDGNLCAFLDRFMSENPNAGGIAVNWCIFGSSGCITKPEGGVLENYTMRSEDNFEANLHIKTICDPQKVFFYGHCHYPTYRKGFCNLDENGNIVTGPFTSRVSFSKIRINHYYCKSREEYIAKMKRGRADALLFNDMSNFNKYNQNVMHDTEILSRI